MTLINGVERNKAHPDTFHIPDEDARKALPVGAYAKVGIEENGGGERMWFKILSVVDGSYVGELNNYPTIVTMKYGDLLTFGPENVLAIENPTHPN